MGKDHPHFYEEIECNPPHVMRWTGMTSDHLIGPYFWWSCEPFQNIAPVMLQRTSTRTWRQIHLCFEHGGTHTDVIDKWTILSTIKIYSYQILTSIQFINYIYFEFITLFIYNSNSPMRLVITLFAQPVSLHNTFWKILFFIFCNCKKISSQKL